MAIADKNTTTTLPLCTSVLCTIISMDANLDICNTEQIHNTAATGLKPRNIMGKWL